MKNPEYITVKQAASKYGVHENTIRAWCKNGTLRAIKPGRAWLIKKDQEEK